MESGELRAAPTASTKATVATSKSLTDLASRAATAAAPVKNLPCDINCYTVSTLSGAGIKGATT
jgi:hypothetical protein